MDDAIAYAYQRIASDLRTRILSNDLKPGTRLPTEADLRQRYRVSRNTVCRAFGALCAEGLAESRLGLGIYVRAAPDHIDAVALEPGDTARARMPAPDERARLRLPEGVPLLTVTDRGGTIHLYPSDRTELCSRRRW